MDFCHACPKERQFKKATKFTQEGAVLDPNSWFQWSRPVPKLGSYLGSPTRDPLKLLHDFVLIG